MLLKAVLGEKMGWWRVCSWEQAAPLMWWVGENGEGVKSLVHSGNVNDVFIYKICSSEFLSPFSEGYEMVAHQRFLGWIFGNDN